MTTDTFIQPFKSMANYFSKIGRDVDSVIERDPAARSKLEVMLQQLQMQKGAVSLLLL